MQNYRAGPVGPATVRRDGLNSLWIEERGDEGERGGEGGQEGPAAPQPTSTLGLVKVSAAGPTLLTPFLFLTSSFVSLLPFLLPLLTLLLLLLFSQFH